MSISWDLIGCRFGIMIEQIMEPNIKQWNKNIPISIRKCTFIKTESSTILHLLNCLRLFIDVIKTTAGKHLVMPLWTHDSHCPLFQVTSVRHWIYINIIISYNHFFFYSQLEFTISAIAVHMLYQFLFRNWSLAISLRNDSSLNFICEKKIKS